MTVNKSLSCATGTRRLIAPELLSVLEVLPTFTYNERNLPSIREAVIRALKTAPVLPLELHEVSCEQRFVPGPAGAPNVRILIYFPASAIATPFPVYFHLHGGGYILGSPEISDRSNRAIALELNCVVVSVDYRLAPETRHPGGLEDCYAALLWLHSEADKLGVDRNRIVIGGENAGGGLAAMLGLLARDRGVVPIRLQLLDSPMLDDRTGSSTEPHPYCGEFVWTAQSNRFAWRSLLGVDPDGSDVPSRGIPSRVAELSGLPPTFIMVGSLDLFLEEGLEYARRLIRAGIPTELHVVPGAYHGFAVAGGEALLVRTSSRLRNDALARAFSRQFQV
jgi:triacylglycerol lipase